MTAPEHFSTDNLQHALQVARHKEVVDIIFLVKNAAAVTSRSGAAAGTAAVPGSGPRGWYLGERAGA